MTMMHISRRVPVPLLQIVVNASSSSSTITKPNVCCWRMINRHVGSLSHRYSQPQSRTVYAFEYKVLVQHGPPTLQNNIIGLRSSQARSFSTTSPTSSSELIYQGPLTNVVKGVKFFSLSTTIMSGCIIPVLLVHGDNGVMTTIGISFATLMLATPIVLHWLSRSYVTRLYFDEKENSYTATTVTFILREATHRFKTGDVTVPPVRNVFTSFVANGRPFLVDPRGFSEMQQFSNLMGQDDGLSQEDIDKIMKKMKDDED